MLNNGRRTRAFWIFAAITVFSALVSAGFSLVALRGEGPMDVYAMYAASRSVSLLVVLVVWFRSRGGVAAMALTMGLVQMFDAQIGLRSHDPSKTYGPLVLAVATFVSLAYLLRSSDGGLRRMG
jgi:hypothetical protein